MSSKACLEIYQRYQRMLDDAACRMADALEEAESARADVIEARNLLRDAFRAYERATIEESK